ncbi:MAG: DUF1501 domain-containing protein [Planctomycetes bacterium]|nr:DUF1501 domain-containing protein [Planctomycetota bacterium]
MRSALVPYLPRRQFLQTLAGSLTGGALHSLLHADETSGSRLPHFAPRAKRVIYLFMAGGVSPFETWDEKPELLKRAGENLPDSVRQGQRLTGMSGFQAKLPLVPSAFAFKSCGASGTRVSELLPATAKWSDELCVVRSLFTEAINHDPAITFFQTGSQQPGRPSTGAWASYGLGSESSDLPGFVVLVTKGRTDQPLYARLWGSGFLPARHQGVQLRAGAQPVLYLEDPAGVERAQRAELLRDLHALEASSEFVPEEEVEQRRATYELAFRLQTAAPEACDLASEPESVRRLYGPEVATPGTFAANCLLARRLVERGVRFVQLFHQGWDHHGNLPGGMRQQCRDIDQPCAALLEDLQQRGLLEDTLVVWTGEFGRTSYSQGKITRESYGRDHHPRCFTGWLAGAGVKKGIVYGETCPFGYNVVKDPVHVHDWNATLLHLMGFDHERLSYPFQGRRYRLTDVHGSVVRELLA